MDSLHFSVLVVFLLLVIATALVISALVAAVTIATWTVGMGAGRWALRRQS